jgi:hypothetical protein
MLPLAWSGRIEESVESAVQAAPSIGDAARGGGAGRECGLHAWSM